MNVGIVGLGLIGGSFAKAIKSRTEHRVWGRDVVKNVLLKARTEQAIDDVMTPERLKKCDLVLLALFPETTLEWLQKNCQSLRAGTIVVDCCGIKQDICRLGFELAQQHGFIFIGGHPMAGLERFGFEASKANLFLHASMVLTPEIGINLEALEQSKAFFLSLGFSRITIATPEEHDRVIAYTSQLAHLLSSAYIKSDTAFLHSGISAGSFQDMTRVATLQPEMWAELFLRNRGPLLQELDGLIARLSEYRQALAANQCTELLRLLDEGRTRKAEVDKYTTAG
ncbi:MAG: prephenate dehydrogenase/arogenate dehydrogenase family protein [Lentisphaerae bacterium]|nr:prephenate dehydrogenase/arogenate dehydrogenase family protein [Lentisphaerota bacterium]